MQTPPLPGMPMPHQVELGFRETRFHMVETCERRIELLPEIVGKPRAVARDEAVFASPPFAENIDGIVELGRKDLRQKPRLEHSADEALASGRNDGFFLRGKCLDPDPPLLPLAHSRTHWQPPALFCPRVTPIRWSPAACW